MGSADSVFQIWDTVALWNPLLALEVAFCSQVLRDSLGEERRDSQELVKGKPLDTSTGSVCAHQTCLLLQSVLKGK